MKYFGLTDTKLFHFHRKFKNGVGAERGFKGTPSGSATAHTVATAAVGSKAVVLLMLIDCLLLLPLCSSWCCIGFVVCKCCAIRCLVITH